jgi:hypothetical protein
MSKNRLPNTLPAVPVELDLNQPGAVDKLFYGERAQPVGAGEQSPSTIPPSPAAGSAERREMVLVTPVSNPATADDFDMALERLKALGARGERPHHVHLPNDLDIALRRFAADRKTKATNVLIVALLAYLDAHKAS